MIKKILVSQPKPASEKSPYFDIADEFGVELVFRPFIKVEGLSAKEFRQQKISILNHTAIVSLPAMPSTISSSWPRKCALLSPRT